MKLNLKTVILTTFITCTQVFCLSALGATQAAAQGGVSATVSLGANSDVKSFRDWKSEKVQSAITQLLQTRSQLSKAKTQGQKTESLDRAQTQAVWNLEAANELSAADYFVMYLSQQEGASSFQAAAQRLTTSEIAEIFQAYSRLIGTEATIDIGRQSNNPGDK